MPLSSKESGGYGDLMFELTLSGITKCSRCNEEVECAECEVELCKFVICKTCSKLGNYGVLESHSYGHCDKDDYANWLDILEHVSTCGNQLCAILSCKRARELMTHLHDCKKRLQGLCTKCKKIWVGVCAHETHCTKLCVMNKLSLLNQCDVMQRYMTCKGSCLASAGADQPAEVVHDAPRDLYPGACLYSRTQSMLSCDGSHQYTRGLCPCA